MLLEDWESRKPAPPPPPRKEKWGGASRRTVAIAAIAAVALAIVAGAGVVLSQGSHASSTPVAAKLHAVSLPATAVPKSWHLTFDSDFSGSALDTKVWGTCYPGAQSSGCTNYGNTSDVELEWYLSSQDQVSGGALHLTAQQEPTPGFAQDGAAKEYGCRSGMVTTYPSLNFTYGFLQITAKIPFGKGLWPALWLAASNGKWPPEVDLLEHWGTEPFGKVYFHPVDGARQGGDRTMPNLASGYHTFSLLWTKTSLVWYYDGTKVLSSTTHIPQQAMYLIMNLADDQLGTGDCDGSLVIQSVKLWQP